MNKLNLKYDENSDRKNIREISNILQYISIKMKENKLYINSNCQIFFKNLETQIINAKKNVEQNYKKNLKECFEYFDLIFDKDIDLQKTDKQKHYKSQVDEIIEELDKLESKYEIEKIFDKYLDEILAIFTNIRNNKEKLISKYKNNIKELIQKELQEKSNEILENLNNEIEQTMLNLDEEISKSRLKLLDLFKKGLEKELKRGKYKAEIDILVKYSFYEKIKLKICDLFCKKDYNALAIGINIILGTIFAIFFPYLLIGNGLFFLFPLWNKIKEFRNILDEKLNESEEQCQINFSRMRIKFSRIYKDSLNETKNRFKELLLLSCIDLSKIEEKNWIKLKERYIIIKKNIIELPNEQEK